MKIASERPHSSFLSVEKDMNIIISKMLSDERLKRLLYYASSDCISSKPNLTEDESYELLSNGNIRIVPKIKVDKTVLNYVVIKFDDFMTNMTNPEFRDNIIEFDILCHFDQWQLEDFQLRPYRIAAEIDTLFNEKHLTGIGTLQFLSANQIVDNDEFGGLCILYAAIHGGEDKKPMANPKDEEQFFKDYNAMRQNWTNGSL